MSQEHLPHNHGQHSADLLSHIPASEHFATLADLFHQLGDSSRIRIFWILCHCEECVINLKSLMADGNTLPKTLEEIIVPDDVRKRLGLKNETIFGEELIITCENPGGGVIKIVMVAGGDSVGGGNTMGGMRIEKEIALVVSSNYTATDGVVNNPGGWL